MVLRRDKQRRERRWLVTVPESAPGAAEQPGPPTADDDRGAVGVAAAAPTTERGAECGPDARPERPLFETPQAPPTIAPPPAPAPEPSQPCGPRPVRWLVLGGLTLLGGVALAIPERDCSGFNSAGEVVGAILAAAIAVAFWFAVIATAVYLVRRARHRRCSWRDAQLSTSTARARSGVRAACLCWSVDPSFQRLRSERRCGAQRARQDDQRPRVERSTALGRHLHQRLHPPHRRRDVGPWPRKRMLAAIKQRQWTRAAVYATTQRRLLNRYGRCLRGVVPTDDPDLAEPASRSASSIAPGRGATTSAVPSRCR
jgi:hypothetical protein